MNEKVKEKENIFIYTKMNKIKKFIINKSDKQINEINKRINKYKGEGVNK